MAFDGDEPVGFFGVVPRRMRYGDRRLEAHLLSFLAVRPAWRGPLTFAIYTKLVEVIRAAGKPVVTFPQPGSIAERMLFWNFERAGFRTCSLGSYRTYGAVSRPGPSVLDARAMEGDEDEFLEVIRCCRDERTLWSDPDRDQLRHYREDPSRRALALVRDGSDRPIGAAMVALSEVVSPQGLESIPMIDSVFLPRPSAEALIALVRFASERWAGRATSPVVSAPNLAGIDVAILRAAGLRATPSVFQGYFFVPMTKAPPEAIAGTNLEIV
jgi:hypothetical protein